MSNWPQSEVHSFFKCYLLSNRILLQLSDQHKQLTLILCLRELFHRLCTVILLEQVNGDWQPLIEFEQFQQKGIAVLSLILLQPGIQHIPPTLLDEP